MCVCVFMCVCACVCVCVCTRDVISFNLVIVEIISGIEGETVLYLVAGQ